MAISDISDSQEFEPALGKEVKFLEMVAAYGLEHGIQKRMRDLGERKEFLTEPEHEELMVLVSFAEKRYLEKLEAQVALKALS